MIMPISNFGSHAPETHAVTRVESPMAERWNRWVFKAPPLAVETPTIDLRAQLGEIQNRLSGE